MAGAGIGDSNPAFTITGTPYIVYWVINRLYKRNETEGAAPHYTTACGLLKQPDKLKINYATHETKEIRQWFLRHLRYTLHFTPTHTSWLNQVERRFALLSQRQIKLRFSLQRELKTAIAEFIAVHNEQPKPFVWTKTADAILSSIGRFASRTLAEHGANNV